MNKHSLKFLEELIRTPSPSGFETPGQKVIMAEIKPAVDQLEDDVSGNLIGIKNPKGKPKIMLAGHVDEIGFMVMHIDDQGFLHLKTIGAPRLNCASGQDVVVHTDTGPVPGVMIYPNKALSGAPAKDDKELNVRDFWVDIGAKDQEDARKSVSIGDPVTYAPQFNRLKNNIVSGRAFDDRIGSFIIAEALKALKKQTISASVYGVSTVQEETGSRGAVASGFNINPDIAIAIDVVHATDSPELDAVDYGEVALGKGPVLLKGCNVNPVLGELLVETAERNKIPYQLLAAPMPTWTDANPLQIIRGGAATALVKIPNRYMHAPTELISLDDVDNAVKLLVALIKTVKPGMDFKPLSDCGKRRK